MKRILVSLLFLVSCAYSQGNCNLTGTFSGTGRSQAFDNRTTKCDLWAMISHNTNGFSALSIEVDGAPDSNGSPGAWFAVAAIPPTSAPCTDINTCYIIAKVAYPWMSVNVTSTMGTGKISFRLSGVNSISNVITASSGGAGGGGGSSLTLETNGTNNGSQTLLNLINGSNVTITDNGSGGITIASTPGGAAGGDLSGTYPNPTVSKVNATSIPTNAAADQIINTTAAATGQWTSLPNCQDTAGQHLNYNTTTHAFSCGTSTAGGTGGFAFGPLYSVGSVSGLTGCTQTGFTGATFSTLTSGAISFQTTNNAGSFNIEYCSIPAPATPYKITMQLIQTSNTLNTNAFAGAGLAWSDGTKFTTFRVDKSSPPNVITVQMTNATTGSANQTVEAQSGVGNTGQWGSGQYLQIIDTGANRITCYSFDGVKYFQHDTVGRTTFLTPTTIGPFVTNSGMIILSWTQTSGTTCG